MSERSLKKKHTYCISIKKLRNSKTMLRYLKFGDVTVELGGNTKAGTVAHTVLFLDL